MSNKDVMFAKLPGAMRQAETEKFYNVMGKLYDDFDTYLESKQNNHVVDLATGDELDAIGFSVGVPRDTGIIDEQYRRRLKYFYSSVYFVPTLNNFYHLVFSILGEYPTNIKEGWKHTGESGFLELDIIYPGEETDDFLGDLDRLYSAGCRLKWNKFRKVWAVYNQIGDFDSTGFTEIYDDKEMVIHPWDYRQFRTQQNTSDDSPTGELQELDQFILWEGL